MSDRATSIISSSETDTIYRAGRVSPEVQRQFRTSMDRSIQSQGLTMDQFIEANRKIKMEMQQYLEGYKAQRGLMEAVIYYLRHPDLAGVKVIDKVGAVLGRKLQLEAKKIANDPHAIKELFEQMALSIEHSRNKTYDLEKHAVSLYKASLTQRDQTEKDITILLQKISTNKDVLMRLEAGYDRIKENMDVLLNHMQTDLGMKIRGNRPVLDETPNILNSPTQVELEPKINITKSGNVENAIDVEGVVKMDESEVRAKAQKLAEDNRTKEILEKKKIEAVKAYHAVNNKLVEAENKLRDAKKEKLILHQNYEKAKENLTLYERVLLNQVNEARNYFALLYAIYDAEVKYTLPSARLIAHLASLQEVTLQLAQQIYDSRNIFNSLLDNVTQGALQIQEEIITLVMHPSWDYNVLEQSETRTLMLAQQTNEFSKEMDRRLVEIETSYGVDQNDELTSSNLELDSGIESNYLQKLLSDKK